MNILLGKDATSTLEVLQSFPALAVEPESDSNENEAASSDDDYDSYVESPDYLSDDWGAFLISWNLYSLTDFFRKWISFERVE